MSGLVLESITAGYGGREIIKDIWLKIRSGEFCALLGRNGSGKTTLVKALCGLVPIESGRCLVDGINCAGLHERKRARYLSYIPQRHSKMQGVAVLDAVLMGYNPHLPLLSSPSREDRKRAEDILFQMGMGALIHSDFAHLSEGQKQLVILARALVQDTPVMLMDEPDSALDFANRHMVLQKIRDLIHYREKVGLITLHDPNFAFAYCDSVVLLKDGAVTGHLDLAGTTSEEIRLQLSPIYGEVMVLEQNHRFLITLK
jgi:iron complex transport system ATP-binding protein